MIDCCCAGNGNGSTTIGAVVGKEVIRVGVVKIECCRAYPTVDRGGIQDTRYTASADIQGTGRTAIGSQCQCAGHIDHPGIGDIEGAGATVTHG